MDKQVEGHLSGLFPDLKNFTKSAKISNLLDVNHVIWISYDTWPDHEMNSNIIPKNRLTIGLFSVRLSNS